MSEYVKELPILKNVRIFLNTHRQSLVAFVTVF